jgi:CRISPR/Cas system Type II protein with McrA/HNH and RuvC-like nuclease domain
MDITELMITLVSKGTDYALTQLPTLLRNKEISREDAQLLLLYTMASDMRNMYKYIVDMYKYIIESYKETTEMRKDLNEGFKSLNDRLRSIDEKLDFVISQLKVLNTNISITYELTSKIMARLMESSMSSLPKSA